MAQAAQLARLKPAHCVAPRQELCPLCRGQIAGCPLRHGELGSLACYHSPLPQLHPDQTHPTCPGGLRRTSIPAKVAIFFRRVLGCHPLLSCVGKVLGFSVASFEAWLRMRFVP